MNKIRIQQILQHGNRIDYEYEVSGEWTKYFRLDTKFYAQYSQNIESVHPSIAVLPLVGNVIVMSALFDAIIFVDEIDESFYNCVGEFIEGYQQLSPGLHFKKSGLIEAKKIVSNDSQNRKEKSMLFFSGGVDAWSSLLTHIDEKPVLACVWGADVAYDNKKGWENAYQSIKDAAEEYKLELVSVQSPLHEFINEGRLDEFSTEVVDENWWDAFHHSVGMMCLAAPLAANNIENIYYASTFTGKNKKSWGSYVSASNPLIDNNVRFCGAHIIHDGYEFSRHDKVERICGYYKEKPKKPTLRVCFSTSKGVNCGRCEKCARTVTSILLAGENPEEYGFPYDKERFPRYLASGMQAMARCSKYAFLTYYKYIQDAYREKFSIEQVPDTLKAFYCADLELLADFLNVPCDKCKYLKEDMESVLKGKNWLEQQRNAWMKKAEELEAECIKKDAWTWELQAGKDWLEEQHKLWMQRAKELEAECIEKDAWIRELQAGKDWLEEQYKLWMQRAKELEAERVDENQ